MIATPDAPKPVYQIVNWDEHFENNKSRERDECSFVCVPNKQDGLGLTYVLAEPDGGCIYGIWCLIVGACSRQRRQDAEDGKKRLGYLTDDGLPTGRPWSARDLALRWRRKPEEVQRALDLLCSPEIGWIRRIDPETSQKPVTPDGDKGLGQSARQVPAECPTGALEGKGREEKGSEGEKPPAGAARPAGSAGKAEAKKPRKPATGPHAEVVTHYCWRFEETYGIGYVFDDGKDGRHVKEILGLLGGDASRVMATIDAYFARTDAYLVDRRHPLGTLRSQLNQYTPSTTATSPRPPSKASPGVEWKPAFTDEMARELSRAPYPGEPDYVGAGVDVGGAETETGGSQ